MYLLLSSANLHYIKNMARAKVRSYPARTCETACASICTPFGACIMRVGLPVLYHRFDALPAPKQLPSRGRGQRPAQAARSSVDICLHLNYRSRPQPLLRMKP